MYQVLSLPSKLCCPKVATQSLTLTWRAAVVAVRFRVLGLCPVFEACTIRARVIIMERKRVTGAGVPDHTSKATSQSLCL